jgi:hypothetical protein
MISTPFSGAIAGERRQASAAPLGLCNVSTLANTPILPGEVPARPRYQLDLSAKGNLCLVLVWHQVRKVRADIDSRLHFSRFSL